MRSRVFPHKEGIVALLFTANAAFTKAFEETRGVQEFYYWDNTDRPKKISKEEWMRRGRIWSEVLPGAGVPIENGFLLDFTAVLPFGELTKKIISYVPSKEQRAEVIAFNHMVNKRYEKLIAGQKNKLQMSLYCDARRWGKKKVEIR